jgi:Leucine-rich repeat (LRR) protein
VKRFLMILLCVTVIITLFPVINVQAEDTVVNFPDPILETQIRQAINKPAGDIYQSDLEQLTSLYVSDTGDKHVVNLSGLEHCVNLTRLDFSGCQYLTDLTQIAGLTNLTALYLHGCHQITDISPLAGLTKLTTFSTYYCPITDISPLAGLTKMEQLNLQGSSNLTDISPLAGLTEMKNLCFEWTKISDISPLAGMTKMENLRIKWGNQVKDISVLSGMTNIYMLFLNGSNITDITALVNNPGLGAGDFVDMSNNYLDTANPYSTDMINIRILQDRGVNFGGSQGYSGQKFAWESVAVSPSSPANLDINSTMQFTATGTFSYDSTRDATTEASWSSSDPTVATIDANGLVTSLTAGTTNITASLGSIISSPVTLTVSSSPLQSIEQLISEVQGLNISQGTKNSLDAKLQNVKKSLEANNSGNRNDAINKMQAFINACKAQIGKALSADQANMLIEKANKIIASLQAQ